MGVIRSVHKNAHSVTKSAYDEHMRKVDQFTRNDGTKSYRVRFRYNGRQTSETFSARRAAERFARLLDDLGAQGALDQIYAEDQAADVPTLADYGPQYIESLTGVTEGTRSTYRRILTKTWMPAFGQEPMSTITRHDVAQVINRLSAAGKSDKTVANEYGFFAALMRSAILDGHLAVTPCRGISLPKNTGHLTRDPVFLTEDEYLRLHAAMADHFGPLLDMLAGTGIRWSEAEALIVRDIDFTAKRVHITKAIKWDSGASSREVGPPKTKRSRRSVTLPDSVVVTLADLVRDKAKTELLFTMPRGGQLRHRTFWSRYWKPACEAAELDPRPRIHDLRHSHASWLIAAHVPLPVIQARLGHEKITTTVDTYGHLLPESEVAAADAANRVFAPVSPAIER